MNAEQAMILGSIISGGGGSGGDVPIATTTTAGKVKPDGTSITVEADGTIHSQAGAELTSEQMTALLALI